MRILLVNKFIFPKGGAETYTFDVGKMLEEHGHEVQYFGLENEKNTVGNRIGSYVTNMDFSQGIKANLNAPFRIIYSREARKKIRAVLDDFQPDVVHLNNIQYHLTPSIILETNKWRKETKKECKIVYTTHDYQLVCPSHGMFDVDMKPCERCLDGHYIHCLQTKCLKNSRAKSLLGTLDGYMWKYSKAYSYVDAYICCSYFLKSKLDTQKRFRDKTIGLHNFKKEMPHLDNIQKKGYVLEFGHTDLMRVALLEHYGGTWMDATILLTDEIPQEILNSDFFVFHNSLGEIDNPVLYPVWFIHAKQHNRTICEIRNVLFAYWKRNNHVPEYLFSNIVITQIMRSSPEVEKKMPYLNSDYSEYLVRVLGDKFTEEKFNWIKRLKPRN